MSSRSSIQRAAAALLCIALLTPIAIFAQSDPQQPPATLLTQPRPEPSRDVPTVAQARSLQSAGRWDEAARAWSRILNADPDNANAWFNFGYCLHLGGHLDDAIRVHLKATTFEEYRGIALYNLGCAYALTGRPDEAFDALFRSQAAGFEMRGQAESDSDLDSLREDPRYAQLLAAEPAGFWGRVRHTMGAAANAIQREAPRIQQQLTTFAHEAQQVASGALDQLRRSLNNNQHIRPVVRRLENLLGIGGQRSAPTTTTISPAPPAPSPPSAPSAMPDRDDAQSPLVRAQSLQARERWLDAAKAYQSAAERDPDNAMIWFNLAYCLHMGKDYEHAIPAHKKAASYEQTRGIALYNLACAYSLTGQVDEAIDALMASQAAGFAIGDYIATDTDLDNLRDDKRFIELQKELGIDY